MIIFEIHIEMDSDYFSSTEHFRFLEVFALVCSVPFVELMSLLSPYRRCSWSVEHSYYYNDIITLSDLSFWQVASQTPVHHPNKVRTNWFSIIYDTERAADFIFSIDFFVS